MNISKVIYTSKDAPMELLQHKEMAQTKVLKAVIKQQSQIASIAVHGELIFNSEFVPRKQLYSAPPQFFLLLEVIQA